MGIRAKARCAWLLSLGLAVTALGSPAKTQCSTALAQGSLLVTPAAKEALDLGKRSGILEAHIVLQIPTSARGVLPPYVQLIVERDRLQKALEEVGANVTPAAAPARGVARLTLRVVGPYRKILPVLFRNPWIARLATDGDLAVSASAPVAIDHDGRKHSAHAFARREALRPTSLELENRIVSAIRDGFAPEPDAVEVQLLATVGSSSLFLATLPFDGKDSRHTLAFLLRVEQRSDAHDVSVHRVLTPEELGTLVPQQIH